MKRLTVRHHAFPLVLALACACNGDYDANQGGANAAADAGSGESCTPFATTSCVSGDVYWVDSCGELGERSLECTRGTLCNAELGAYCRSAATSGTSPDNAFPMQVTFQHPSAGAEYELRFEVLSDPGPETHLWLMMDFNIDNTRVIWGPNTDSSQVGEAGQRKSIAMSRLDPGLTSNMAKPGASGSYQSLLSAKVRSTKPVLTDAAVRGSPARA